jgi:cytidylate kinase
VDQRVWLIAGAQASGKATVADLLARRFHRGVHLRGGQFYPASDLGYAESTSLDLRYSSVSEVCQGADSCTRNRS